MLRWCDIHFGNDSYLRIEPHEGWTPKTKSSVRNVPLTPSVESMLKSQLAKCESMIPTARVFPETWHRSRVGHLFRRFRKAASLNEPDDKGQLLRVHSLRHYYASLLVRNGTDPATVRDLLGHESIVTTNRYFQTPREELFNAVHSAFTRHRNVTDSSRIQRFPAENAQPSSM